MKQPVDLARAYLKLADRDLKAFELLIRSREIADETVGFHAQQAVEKCLKAVLAFSSIPFRKTHDLQELMDLLIDNKKTLPPNAEKLDFNLTLAHPRIDQTAAFSWSVDLLPRTGRMAGWELLTNVDIVTVAPEMAAKKIREVWQ